MSQVHTQDQDEPQFQHDCDDCTFLGRSDEGTHDLYFCPQESLKMPTIIARFGERGDYYSGMVFAKSNPFLAQAYQRAKERGLIK